MNDLARRLAVARGDAPADLVLHGAQVLSVFTREWLDVDVAARRLTWPRSKAMLADARALVGGGTAGAVEDVTRVR